MPRRRRPSARSGNPLRVGSNKNKLSLTASAMRVRRRDADSLRRLVQPWQERSFAYYDQVGEIKYAAQFYARMLAPLRLYAAETDESGDLVETQNETAIATLDRVQDPGGGRSGLLGGYGRLMFLVGESLLFVSEEPDTGVEQWEMLSSAELRIQSGIYMRYKAPSLMAEDYREPSDDDWEPVTGGNAIAYRLWRRHPKYSALPDATMLGVLDIAEELLLLTQAVRARARSRLAGPGILAISDDFSQAPLEPTPDEDADVDPFLADLTEAMTTPITDEGSASAVVPLIVRGSTDAVEKGIRHIQIVDPTQLYPETGLRMECVRRLALGLDMPPEVLLGLTDATHWSAWAIGEETWKGHGQPVAQQLCDDLTSSFFRPTLKAEGVTDWQRYAVAYDASAIINHPDRSKDAKDLYGQRAIGKRALRDANGFDEEDAPTREELAEMIGVQTRDSSLAWYGIPAPRGLGVEVAPGDIVAADESPPPDGASSGAEVEPGPPAAAADETRPGAVIGAGNGHRDIQIDAARIAGAADLALLRAREAAGNRLRSLARKDPDALNAIQGIPARGVAAALGRARLRALGAPPERDLFAGTRDLVEEALRLWGIEDEAVIALVADSVEQHAARTLYDERPKPLPPSFMGYLAGVLAGAPA